MHVRAFRPLWAGYTSPWQQQGVPKCMARTPHVGPTMLMSQPLRLIPVHTQVNTITDNTCDNASLRRTKCLRTYLLGKRSPGS